LLSQFNNWIMGLVLVRSNGVNETAGGAIDV
jgi:hypothetical protein